MTAGPRATPSLSPHSAPPALLQTRTWKDVSPAKRPGALRAPPPWLPPLALQPWRPSPTTAALAGPREHTRGVPPGPARDPPSCSPHSPRASRAPGKEEGEKRHDFTPKHRRPRLTRSALTRADLLEFRARGEARGGGATGSEPHRWHRKDPEVRAMPDAPQPPQTQESPLPAGQASSVRGRICFRFRRDGPWAPRRGAWLPTGRPGLRRK